MSRASRYLFGPVPSRRFGRSLGIDLTPFKTCSLNCVFCQLGRTTRQTVERRDYVPTSAVLTEIDDWLETDGEADVVTLSGSGEPTLHSGFGEVIEFIRSRSNIPVLLLTNGTMLHLPEVRDAAAGANMVKVSLSAWDEESFQAVNRACTGVTFNQLVEGEEAFRKAFLGKLFLEVFLLRGINSTPADVKKIAAFAGRIGPDRVQLNTAVRPPAEDFAAALPRRRMAELVELFSPPAEVIAEFSATRASDVRVNEGTILAMLQRRPCTAEQVAAAFRMHLNEASKYVGELCRTGRVHHSRREANVYYMASDRL